MNVGLTAAEIAARLSLSRSRRGFRGRCPACGNDTLEARDRQSRTYVVCFYGCAFAETQRAAWGGAVATALPSKPEKSTTERTEAAAPVWSGAANDHPALPAYFASRGLIGLELSLALRRRIDVRHPEIGGFHPAMLGLVMDVNGTPNRQCTVPSHSVTEAERQTSLR